MAKIRRAIVSVSDKSGVVSFAKGLAEMGSFCKGYL
jgi:AICAR transformylase/IMP cyclohydrolase PurH